MSNNLIVILDVLIDGPPKIVGTLRLRKVNKDVYGRVLATKDGQVALFGNSRHVQWLKLERNDGGGPFTIREASRSGPLPATPLDGFLTDASLTVTTDAGLCSIGLPNGIGFTSLTIDAQVICRTTFDANGHIVERRLDPRDTSRPWRVTTSGAGNESFTMPNDVRLHPFLGMLTRDGRVVEAWQASDERLVWSGLSGATASSVRIRGAAGS